MLYKEIFEVDIMNIKLKKIKILEPKVKITTGLKTITRESKGEKNIPLPSMLTSYGTLPTIVGVAEMGDL